MNNNSSYSIEEVSQLLKVSKLTVYDLVKKMSFQLTELVGRQMRIEQRELEKYKSNNKIGSSHESHQVFVPAKAAETSKAKQVLISRQDFVLDLLSKYIENQLDRTPLRMYNGSLNSLISMYNGNCDIVSMHLYDGETGEYNLPYAKRILVREPFIMINLVSRKAGFYVAKGNPQNICTWKVLELEYW